jgi:histidinol phosphatase-like enzyme
MDLWGSKQPKDDPSKYTKCVVGLDRDGTINRDLGTYVTRPQDFDPIPGSLVILKPQLKQVQDLY